MNNGIGSQVVGGAVVVMLAVITVGAIFQLNKPNTPLVPAATNISTTALSDLFK